MRNDRIIPITVTLLGSLLLASCGNTLSRGSLNSYSETGGSVSYGSPANVSGATTTSDGYTCPSQPNVNTTGDPSFTGTDDYTVCTSSSSTTKILVHGKTANSQTICIFPAQRVDEQHLYAKPDVTTGLPLVQCSTISSGGVYADFSGVNYNAAFIVEGPDKDQMQQCLAMGQPYSCPAYSYGQFRN